MEIEDKNGQSDVHFEDYNQRWCARANMRCQNPQKSLWYIHQVIFKEEWHKTLTFQEWVTIDSTKQHDSHSVL